MFSLPKWVLTNRYPSVFDTESKTAIEQTARVYGAMNELIEEHNKYMELLSSEMAKFEAGVITTNDCFRNNITKVINEYIKSVDNKILTLEAHLKNNVKETLNVWISEGALDETIMSAFADLKSRVEDLERNANAVVYNEETESLDLAEV